MPPHLKNQTPTLKKDGQSILHIWNENKDTSAITQEIKATLNQHGYIHINQPMPVECFEQICGELGKILFKSNMSVSQKSNDTHKNKGTESSAKSRPSIHEYGKIDFHTDSPIQNLLGWQCLIQDEFDGALLMLDCGDLHTFFTRKEIELMKTIPVHWTERIGRKEKFHEYPLVKSKDEKLLLYYAPWFLLDHYPKEQEEALAKFKAYLNYKTQNQLLKVRLKPLESMFIDNQRMLHARGEIAENSKRRIVRVVMQNEQS